VKILLTGKTGQVGWELERVLPPIGEVIATDGAGFLSDGAATTLSTPRATEAKAKDGGKKALTQ